MTGGSNVPEINRLIGFSGLKFSERTITNSVMKNGEEKTLNFNLGGTIVKEDIRLFQGMFQERLQCTLQCLPQ